MEQEVDSRSGASCTLCCDLDSKARYRCLECFDRRVLCQSCIVTRHKTQPFHRVQEWNGRFFAQKSLDELDLKIYLGHDGDPCPSSRCSTPKRLVVIHTNGVHTRRLVPCWCAEVLSPEPHQLLRSRFFPATWRDPKTAFTFDVLKAFHTLQLVSKISAQHFFDVLERYSNPVSPDLVEVCNILIPIMIFRSVDLYSGSISTSGQCDAYLGPPGSAASLRPSP